MAAPPADSADWRRNVFAVTAAAFLGFTGFTLVMPFLPLYFRQLGLTDTGDIAFWTGLCLGVTPGITALMSPFWGRLADRFGRKIMVERSLLSFVVVMALTAYVTAPWQVLALRTLQGFFAGYGALAVAMAAESVPPSRLALGIGVVQTAQRLGPATGPVIGGVLAELLELRQAFLVSALFYLGGFVLVLVLYRERPRSHADQTPVTTPLADMLRLPNLPLLLVVIFAVQFIDRSFGPILTLFVEESGLARDRVALTAGVLFALAACAGAFGNLVSGSLVRRTSPRAVIAGAAALSALGGGIFALEPSLPWAVVASSLFGLGVGISLTTAFSVAGGVMNPESRATGFALLTSAALVGMAISPPLSGLIGALSIRAVFVADVAALVALAAAVGLLMRPAACLAAPEAPASTTLDEG